MDKDNLKIFNALKTVPQEAQKRIDGGRLNGKTDINPMWRIMALTEQFGPCGVGWKYTIDKQWMVPGPAEPGEVAAFCNISLYIKLDGEWSDAIPGTGGSAFMAKERTGLYLSDECYKMALTDALSVAAKALGVGASIYWQDGDKYLARQEQASDQLTAEELKAIKDYCYVKFGNAAGKAKFTALLQQFGGGVWKNLKKSQISQYTAWLDTPDK